MGWSPVAGWVDGAQAAQSSFSTASRAACAAATAAAIRMSARLMVFSPVVGVGVWRAASATGGQGCNGCGNGGDGVFFPVDQHVLLLVNVLLF